VKPFSAAVVADRRPPWQDPQRLRQLAAVAGALVLLYAVLLIIALLGGPRIGAPFLPLPGGGPAPANPVAGLQPGQPTTDGPSIPRGSQTTTAPAPTPLPSATTRPAAGYPTTYAPVTPYDPAAATPQVVDARTPTTETLPPPTTPPYPTQTPTNPPLTPTPALPSSTPTVPQDPPSHGFLGTLLDKLGL
jgi:hypothetical protein